MFHQIEGLVIDKGVTMADLKGTLETLIKAMYGEDSVIRFRPHHFPFTEPSCEVDVQCFKCRGAGCPTCKGEGWIELLGAGMAGSYTHLVSTSKSESTFWHTQARRSRPMPVSMFFCLSSV